ncbi:MAG: TatD DNase family protein [Saprospiraceae bacterium]|jgi:TatD DNase family protein
MEFIDTHAHLYAEQFDNDRSEMLEKARALDIKRFYLPNIDSTSIDAMLGMEAKYPQDCFSMMGVHPCSIKADFKKELAIAEEWLQKRKFVGIGEIGIDLYWDKTFIAAQKEAFRTQINWARDLGLPFVIHSRDSLDLTIEIVEEEQDGNLSGIFHCFGGSLEQAKRIIDLGFYLGIGGVITFKKSGLDTVVKEVDLDYLVLETDAPYLAPTPFRGKRNESAYIHPIAEKLASVKETPLEKVAELTSRNALKVFKN